MGEEGVSTRCKTYKIKGSVKVLTEITDLTSTQPGVTEIDSSKDTLTDREHFH